MNDEKTRSRSSRRARGAGTAVLAALLLGGSVAAARAAEAPPPPTKTLAAGARYEASGFHRFFLGSGYRDLWTLPDQGRGARPRELVGRARRREEGRRQADAGAALRGRGRPRVEVPLGRQGPHSRAPVRAPGLVRRSHRPGPDQRVAPARCARGGRARGRGRPASRRAPAGGASGRPSARRVPRGVQGHAGHARGEPFREVAGDARVRGLHEDRRHRRARGAARRGSRGARRLAVPAAGAPRSTW